MAWLSVGQVAHELGARPQDISMLFYSGVLRGDLCPVASGRRLIARDYVPMVAAALKRRGKQVRDQAVRGDPRHD